MPDTGAPWNIPYVESTDLVSDWPADSLALANAIAGGLDDAGNAGIGSNVVQTVKLDTFATSSATFVAVTDFDVTITPSSATSKVLVLAYFKLVNDAAGGAGAHSRLVRDATDTIFIGADDGGRLRTTASRQGGESLSMNVTISFLDSPNTTDPVTYAVHVRTGTAGTVRFGTASDVGSTDARFAREPASIIAIEVAA